MRDVDVARSLLNGDITCVFSKNGDTFTSKKRGIAPLLELIESKRQLVGYSAADRIVGKAAALLYTHMGVSAVYGEVMTSEAAALLTSHGICAEWSVSAEAIVSRDGRGLCPMEETVRSISSPGEAVPALRKRLAALQGRPLTE